MQIKALGCAGGVEAGLRTTAFLLDADTLIDAGTGLYDLSLEAQLGIHHIFLTHAHFDHIAGLPFLVENASRYRQEHNLPPIQVYARAEVLDDLRHFMFNNHIWPDFTRLPSVAKPTLQFMPLTVGSQIPLPHGRIVEAISAVHTVPSVGYAVHHDDGSWLYTGDTSRNPQLWQFVNRLHAQGKRLRWLVSETTFSNQDQAFADLTGHYTTNSLAQDISEHLNGDADFKLYLMHLKPSDREDILQDIGRLRDVLQEKGCSLYLLEQSQVFDAVEEDNIRSLLPLRA